MTTPEPGADAGIDDIQADIDRTRRELGDTVEALSAKLDVKEQARQKAAVVKERTTPVVPLVAVALIAATVGLLIWRRRR